MYKYLLILILAVLGFSCHSVEDQDTAKKELLTKLEDQSSFIEMNIPLHIERVTAIADSINNRDEASRAIFWKISLKTAFNRYLANTNSNYAFVDLWVFCNQINYFFDRGKGVGYFNENQRQIVVLNRLLCKVIDERAYFALSETEYAKVKSFVDKESQQNTIENILLVRPSIKDAWYDYMNMKDHIEDIPQMDLPLAVGNVGDRINAQLARNKNRVDIIESPSDGNNPLLDQFRKKVLTDSIQNKVNAFLSKKGNQKTQILQESRQLSHELEPYIASLQARLQLDSDRREEFIVHNMSQIVERLTTSFWKNLNHTITRILLLVIAGGIIIFALPFGVGIWIGRIYQRRK